jgi:hypothetical protein
MSHALCGSGTAMLVVNCPSPPPVGENPVLPTFLQPWGVSASLAFHSQ